MHLKLANHAFIRKCTLAIGGGRSRFAIALSIHSSLLTVPQADLPADSTVIPIILGSDSTHLTNFAGGKKAWPLYLSIGNIASKARNRPSERAWVLIAYIPSPEFLDPDNIRGTLINRVFHQCMRIILGSLIDAGLNGVHIVDSKGHVRRCYLFVGGHIADLPEQHLIAVASRSTSPFAIVWSCDFGDSTPRPPRTREWILEQIRAACREEDPHNIKRYQDAARKQGLNGVHRPFWADLPRYQPELVSCPDILHGVIGFWRAHLLPWTRTLVGVDEYDRRLMSLQPVIGYRHFKSGIKHLSQWTGREDRELQRVHIAITANCPRVNSRVMQNQRAFHDFLYLVQYQSHSEVTLDYLSKALHDFHRTKDEYIKAGVRRGRRTIIKHMNIPKLFGLSHFVDHIRMMGSSSQYSTEIVESLHRSMAKLPYAFTNHKSFVSQMCRRLTGSERLAHQGEFLRWCHEQDQVSQLESIFRIYTPGYRARMIKQHQENNENLDDQRKVRSRIQQSRLWLAVTPYQPRREIQAVSIEYNLPDLVDALYSFHRSTIETGQRNTGALHVDFIDVWRKLRIRVGDVQDDGRISQEHPIEAIPPSENLPYGRCHCVLVHDSAEAEATGIEGNSFQLQIKTPNNPLQDIV
jgi:Plavaka transposase